MMKRLLTVGAMIGLMTTTAFAQQQQRECATMDVHNEMLEHNPKYAERMAQIEEHTNRIVKNQSARAEVTGVVTIPVVVHVVYNSTSENISAAQIQSQIDILNEDFRATNSDVNNVPSLFAPRVADSEIEFTLDQVVRVSTNTTSFGSNNAVKFNSQGGSNVIDPANKLNMWVCDLSGGLLGYAQFPGGSSSTDGVVMDYQYFGDIGTATAPFDKGRTATHEVGHWLNLRHIWGDGGCSVDDFVSDTPTQGQSNGGCPSFGTNSCSGGDPDMFMNYMDYVNDACMYMFTAGQKSRMRATFENGGGREGFASGTGGGGGGGTTCTPVPGDVTLTLTTDNYGSETTWSLTNGAGSTVASGSGYGNNQTITETFTLADGDYTFTINDSYGDGICCSYGNGSYSLTDGNNASIVSGGSFGSSEATDFCIEGSTGGGGGGGGGNCADVIYTTSFEGDPSYAWNNAGGDINWGIGSGSTPSSSTGPSGGSSSTSYAFVESSGNGTGFPSKTAILETDVDLTGATCASFSYDYHMYGASMGSLSVQVSTNGGSSFATLWSESGDQGNSWNSNTVDLSAYAGQSIKLRFRAVTGNSWQSDFAIDNTEISGDAGTATRVSARGITESIAQTIVGLYPNPTEGTLNVEFPGQATLRVISMSGQTMMTSTIENEGVLDVSGLRNGLYILQLNDGGEVITTKFIKQ